MSGTFQNIRGTSNSSFQIGKGGPTIKQGLGDPNIGPEPGNLGDLWVRRNSRQDLYQLVSITGGTKWIQISSLQTVYDRSSGSIALNSVSGGISITDNAVPLQGNLFEITNETKTNTFFSVQSGPTGKGEAFIGGENVMDYMKRMDFFMQP